MKRGPLIMRVVLKMEMFPQEKQEHVVIQKMAKSSS